VAASNTGSWVRRVGASGGGRSYHRRRPVNFYGILILIVVFGLASVGFARYDYRHPPSGPTQYYAALAFFTCGTSVPSLTPSAGNYKALTGGVLQSSTTGSPTLNQFTSAYPELALTSSSLQLPATSAKKSHVRVFKNGEKCGRHTKDAGKPGYVEIAYWPTLESAKPILTTNASSVPLSTRVQISVAFVPKGVTPPRPPASVISAMINAIAAGAAAAATTTTTTLPLGVTTTSTTTTSTTTTTTQPGH
jgi:hypothetical protein